MRSRYIIFFVSFLFYSMSYYLSRDGTHLSEEPFVFIHNLFPKHYRLGIYRNRFMIEAWRLGSVGVKHTIWRCTSSTFRPPLYILLQVCATWRAKKFVISLHTGIPFSSTTTIFKNYWKIKKQKRQQKNTGKPIA